MYLPIFTISKDSEFGVFDDNIEEKMEEYRYSLFSIPFFQNIIYLFTYSNKKIKFYFCLNFEKVINFNTKQIEDKNEENPKDKKEEMKEIDEKKRELFKQFLEEKIKEISERSNKADYKISFYCTLLSILFSNINFKATGVEKFIVLIIFLYFISIVHFAIKYIKVKKYKIVRTIKKMRDILEKTDTDVEYIILLSEERKELEKKLNLHITYIRVIEDRMISFFILIIFLKVLEL